MAAKIREIVRYTLTNQQRSQYTENDLHFTFRVVVMGQASTGKTCIIRRLLFGVFSKKYESTSDDVYHMEYHGSSTNFPNKKVKVHLQILDCGSRASPSEEALAIFSGNVYVLVHDVNKGESLEDLEELRNKIIRQNKTVDVPILVVGNKTDIDDPDRVAANVLVEATVRLRWKNEFIRVSAKVNYNISDISSKILYLLNIGFTYSPPPKELWCPMTNKWKFAFEMLKEQKLLSLIEDLMLSKGYDLENKWCVNSVKQQLIQKLEEIEPDESERGAKSSISLRNECRVRQKWKRGLSLVRIVFRFTRKFSCAAPQGSSWNLT